MTKTLFISICIALISTNLQGQDSLKTGRSKATGGILFGANMVQFYRANNDIFKFPFKKPVWQWQVGVSVDAINTRRYGLRWELLYNNKGANETFSDKISTTIDSKVNLSYLQFNLFPIIYKPLGNRKFNPFLALGGYYSYLVKSKYSSQVNATTPFIDDVASKNTLKQDYGVDLSLGFYFKKVSLEYRIEAGLPKILNQLETLSSIKNKTHSIIFTVR